MGRPVLCLPEAFALAEAGKSMSEIAAVCGVTRPTVRRWADRNEITLVDGRKDHSGCPRRDLASIERMASMYRQGLTLQKIGDVFHITRERVRQLLRKHGVTSEHGGQHKTAEAKHSAKVVQRNARSLAAYGLSLEDMNKWRACGAVAAFRSQSNAARNRGIEWKLSFAQWIDIWLESGKLEQRGRGKGKYVMSRIKDSGGYEVGNVHIQLATENSADAVKKWSGKTKANPGVFNLYPGLSRPFMAKVGKNIVGRYASEEEAVAARMAFIEANGYALRSNGTSYRLAA
jgi:DNA-binding CsgD family transcriptional regulator